MRKLLYFALALCTALTVTAGVADARPHGPGGHDRTCTGSAVGACDVTVNGHTFSPCSVSAANATGGFTCTYNTPGFNRGGLNGHFGGGLGGAFDRRGPRGIWPYPGLPGGFPQLLNGNLLSLQALGLVGVNANIDVCTYPSWTAFDAYAGPRWGSGWGMVRNRWFQAGQAQAEWLALRNAAGCGGVVVPGMTGWNGLSNFDGLLSGNYLNGSYLNLSGLGVAGLTTVNVCSYGNWDGFSRFLQPRLGGRWGHFQGLFGGNRSMWGSNFNRLRMRANCTPVVTPISQPSVNPAPVVQPAPAVQSAPAVDPAPAASPSTEDNTPTAPVVKPAPPTSSGTIVEVPSGPISTGDAGLAPDSVWVG